MITRRAVSGSTLRRIATGTENDVRRQLRPAARVRLYGGLKWGALFVVPILSIVSDIYTIWGADLADRVCRILS